MISPWISSKIHVAFPPTALEHLHTEDKKT